MTSERELEALACDIYNAHRTERIMAGKQNVASWWGMDARHREHWMKVARRLQPARVPEGTEDQCREFVKMCADYAPENVSGKKLSNLAKLVLAAAPAAEADQAKGEKLGRCCYGGMKPKSACASCAAWHDKPDDWTEQQSGICGEVVEIGDDEDGQPRIVIHTTLEAIRDYPASLLFTRVQVQRTGSRGEVGDA